MLKRVQKTSGAPRPEIGSSIKSRVFGPVIESGGVAYVRMRDLPRLIALWPHELADETLPGRLRVLAKLRSALRTERRRARAGHWSYDLNRHLGLLSAYKGELAALRERSPTPS